jgi:recombination protein RecA
LIRSGAIDIVSSTSLAALVPKKLNREGDMGDSKMGLQARLMMSRKALRELTGASID